MQRQLAATSARGATDTEPRQEGVRCRCQVGDCPHPPRGCSNRVRYAYAAGSGELVIRMLIGVGRICTECADRVPETDVELIDENGNALW